MTGHPTSAILFYATALLERISFYGVRSLIALFIIWEFNAEGDFIDWAYSWGIFAISVGFLTGGLIGLKGMPKLLTMVGLGLQAAAAFSIAFSFNKEMASVGFMLFGLGTGIMRTNSLTFLGQLYQRSKLLDSASQVNYIMLDLGGFLGVFVIGVIGELYGIKEALMVCGGVSLIGMLLLRFANPSKSDGTDKQQSPLSSVWLILVLSFVTSLIYAYAAGMISPHADHFFTPTSGVHSNELSSQFWYLLPFIAIMVVGIILAVVYSYKKVSTAVQLAIGCLIASVAYGVLFSSYMNYQDASVSAAVIGFLFLETCVSLFIFPPMNAYIVRKFELRYSPLIIAIIYILGIISEKFIPIISIDYFGVSLVVISLIFIILLVAFLVIHIKRKNGKNFNSELLDTPG